MVANKPESQRAIASALKYLKSSFNSRLGRNLSEINTLVSGKDVALVGNAQSLFDAARPIDDHEVVVRINRGVFLPDGRTEAGRRTDLLLVATDLGKVTYRDVTDNIVWMSTADRELLNAGMARGYYFYPARWWHELHAILGARPSTGCMGVDFLARMGAGRLTLYGFDFWTTETWYNQTNRPGPHDPDQERRYIETRLRDLEGRVG